MDPSGRLRPYLRTHVLRPERSPSHLTRRRRWFMCWTVVVSTYDTGMSEVGRSSGTSEPPLNWCNLGQSVNFWSRRVPIFTCVMKGRTSGGRWCNYSSYPKKKFLDRKRSDQKSQCRGIVVQLTFVSRRLSRESSTRYVLVDHRLTPDIGSKIYVVMTQNTLSCLHGGVDTQSTVLLFLPVPVVNKNFLWRLQGVLWRL